MKRLFSVLVLCTALAAQDKASHNRFVPKDSQLVVRLGAPAQWRQKFGDTRVAKLLHGKALGPVVEQFAQGFDAGLEKARQEGKLSPELIDGLLQNYAGEIVIAVQIDMADLPGAMAEDRPPHVGVVMSMSPDGKFDLAALAAGLQKIGEEESTKLQDLTVGDYKLRVEKGELETALPQVLDGHLVMVASNDLEKTAAKMLATTDRADHEAPQGTLAVHLQVGTLLGGIVDVVKEQLDAGGAPFDFAEVFQELGLSSIDTFDLTLGNDGDHVLVAMQIGMKAEHQGLFGAFTGDGSAPKLLRLVPADCEAFSTMPFDLGKLYQTIGKVWGLFGEEVPVTFADVESSFTEATKVRLKEDLVDHLGKELLLLGDVRGQLDAIVDAQKDGEEPNPMAMLSGYCLGFSLADGKAFGESLEKALRSRGLHAARKTEEYQGFKVHRLKVAAVLEVEYAVTDDLLLVALGAGEGSHAQLRSVLDAKKAGAAAPAEAVQKRLRGLPEGYSGVGTSSIAGTLQALAGFARKVAEKTRMPEETLQGFELLGTLAEDLKQFGLGDLISASYTTKSGFRSVLRW